MNEEAVCGPVFAKMLLRKEQFLMNIPKEQRYIRPIYNKEPKTADMVAFIFPDGYELVGIVGVIFACRRNSGEILYHICATKRKNGRELMRVFRDVARHRVVCILKTVGMDILTKVRSNERTRTSKTEDAETVRDGQRFLFLR